MIIHNLFPTAAAFFDFGRELTKDERDFMVSQEMKPNEGNTTSKDRKILDHPQFSELRAFVDKSIKEYFYATTAPKFEVDLRLTQSWLNYTQPGQYHHKHAHPNSYLSGVFYVNADPEFDKIYFYKEGYERIKIHTENWNLYNSESWWLPVETGRLVIFPSNLTHMVQTVEARDTRISLAFNTFPVGYVGNDDSLTGLHV